MNVLYGAQSCLNPVNKNPTKVRNVDTKHLNFKGIKYPVHKKDYAKIEKQNISISVFGYENKTPYPIYASKQTFEKHTDLLLLSTSKNSHCFY